MFHLKSIMRVMIFKLQRSKVQNKSQENFKVSNNMGGCNFWIYCEPLNTENFKINFMLFRVKYNTMKNKRVKYISGL
jgi:hypothetical protein